MLTDLTIKNFAIIDDLHISFLPGFTILSGETGAGKSIIIGALNLILGGRGFVEQIRTGENEAIVEALFDISKDKTFTERLETKSLATDDNTLLVKRIISREGKNKILINGSLATLSMLTEIMEPLLNISGQHEHQELLRPQNHTDILDGFGGLLALREQYHETFRLREQIKQELDHLKAEKTRESERKELFSFEHREIEDAHLTPGEEEKLRKEKTILQNAEELMRTSHDVYESLYGSDEAVISHLNRNVRNLREIAIIDPQLTPFSQALDSVIIQLEDIAASLRDYSKKIHFDPQVFEEIDNRLETIHRLKRKYGETIEEILHYQKKIEAEMEKISYRDDRLQVLEGDYEKVSKEALAKAQGLSRKRKEVALALSNKLEEELATLGMKNTRFFVEITQSQFLDEKGMDQIEFLISPNPGEELRPLARIASGGELSRLLLAFKHIFAQEEKVSTLIFDEVDSGIGGATAEVVGKKLYTISRYYQTICITHLPQIACFGDNQYSITKQIEEERTKTRVKKLKADDRVEEIARMLGGTEITTRTRILAREMITGAKNMVIQQQKK